MTIGRKVPISEAVKAQLMGRPVFKPTEIQDYDPDSWIAAGKSLLDFPVFGDDPVAQRILAATLKPELAAHLGRWCIRVGKLASPNEKIGDILTEEKLRALWEETREGSATRAYLAAPPKPGEIPAGQVMVHNSVRPTRKLGPRGFRAWLRAPSGLPAIEPCDCDWAPELGTHYRVRLGKPS
jgi:hypothetical protein